MAYLQDSDTGDNPYGISTPPFIDPMQARRIYAANPFPNPNAGVGADPPPIAPPDAAATGVSPQPSAPAPSDPLQDAIKQNQAAQAAKRQAVSNIPPTPKPKWYNRLGAMAIGAAAGYENAAGRIRPIDPRQIQQAESSILAPNYQRQVADYTRGVTQAQAGVDEAQANLTNQEKVEQAQEQRARGQLYKSTAATYDAEGKRAPRGNYITFGKDGIFDASSGTVVREPSQKDPADYMEIAPDKAHALGIQPDSDGKYRIPKEGIGPYLTNIAKPAPKPTAEERNDEYSQIVGKGMQAGFIKATDLADPVKIDAGLEKAMQAGAITREERFKAGSYPAGKNTPGTQTQAGVERANVFVGGRVLPIYDANNNTIGYRTAGEIKQENADNPDSNRYSPPGEASKILQKNAIFSGLDFSINRAKSAVAQIDHWDEGTRAQLANALRETDPRSGVAKFIQGVIGESMDPQTRNLVIALRGLAEDMMTLRSAASMGQGSDQMRQAILDTLPNAFTADSKMAQDQLDFAHNLVMRLATSYPRLGMPGSASPAAIPGAPGSAAGHVDVNALRNKYKY